MGSKINNLSSLLYQGQEAQDRPTELDMAALLIAIAAVTVTFAFGLFIARWNTFLPALIMAEEVVLNFFLAKFSDKPKIKGLLNGIGVCVFFWIALFALLFRNPLINAGLFPILVAILCEVALLILVYTGNKKS